MARRGVAALPGRRKRGHILLARKNQQADLGGEAVEYARPVKGRGKTGPETKKNRRKKK